MNEKLEEELAKLAAKLNVGVDVLWEALLRQAVINGIASLIQIAVTAGVTWWFCKSSPRIFREDSEPAPLLIVAAILVAIMWTYIFVNISSMVASFFNQEYWALRQITR